MTNCRMGTGQLEPLWPLWGRGKKLIWGLGARGVRRGHHQVTEKTYRRTVDRPQGLGGQGGLRRSSAGLRPSWSWKKNMERNKAYSWHFCPKEQDCSSPVPRICTPKAAPPLEATALTYLPAPQQNSYLSMGAVASHA